MAAQVSPAEDTTTIAVGSDSVAEAMVVSDDMLGDDVAEAEGGLHQVLKNKFMEDLDALIDEGKTEEAKDLCRNTRGPVASICYQGLLRIGERPEEIQRSVEAYADVQVA